MSVDSSWGRDGMSRVMRIAAAQMGAIQKNDSRGQVLDRMLALLEGAAARGANLAVFPELAFTTFFPRWLLEGESLDAYFERAMPNATIQPLFDLARELGVGFYVGYAELTPEYRRDNAAVLVQPNGKIRALSQNTLTGLGRARIGERFQQLEKRYFETGNLGFPAFRAGRDWREAIMGMLICNDRRWPEAWRVLGLQGVELVCVGYNSAGYDPNGGSTENPALRTFHSKLVVQANAYMNATWAIAVAKAGDEDGSPLIGGSCIVDPNGVVLAEATTLGDELLIADCDLDLCRQGKEKMFNFAAHRQPNQYTSITERAGVRSRRPKLQLNVMVYFNGMNGTARRDAPISFVDLLSFHTRFVVDTAVTNAEENDPCGQRVAASGSSKFLGRFRGSSAAILKAATKYAAIIQSTLADNRAVCHVTTDGARWTCRLQRPCGHSHRQREPSWSK